jgi:hypothetical protein
MEFLMQNVSFGSTFKKHDDLIKKKKNPLFEQSAREYALNFKIAFSLKSACLFKNIIFTKRLTVFFQTLN